MLGDVDSKHLPSVHVDFFRHPARTPVGPAFLARKTGASILPLFMRRRTDDPRHHVFRFHPPIFPDASLSEEDDIERMLRAFNECLEAEIVENPGQWAWMHRRWRHPPGRDALRTLSCGDSRMNVQRYTP